MTTEQGLPADWPDPQGAWMWPSPGPAADELREAASKMRELAGAATPGPWCYANGVLWHVTEAGVLASLFTGTGVPVRAEDGAYVAVWPPEVVLEVADWLSDEAVLAAEAEALAEEASVVERCNALAAYPRSTQRALAVARVFLGTDR